ncbi:hypothetical protein MMC30_001513 [Trapelia coarctata]|nr:hypothetical protein [Trapelia coarctata]
MASPPQEPATPEEGTTITITHHGNPTTLTFPHTATIIDLANQISTHLSIPLEAQKLLIPKLGLLKPPFAPTSLSTLPLRSRKIQLLASTASEIASVSKLTSPRPSPPIKAATPTRTHHWRKAQDAARYTFHKLLPLDYLPNPEKSLRFLARLRDDAGIRAAMSTHKFSVPVLTEMNPAEHTTHESRTLGLNRNQGEVIELRLRTDAYDGYRDYKTIRKTLCHELAHNVHGPHDRNFWNLCQEIEKEVEKGDWKSGGRAVGREEFYNPEDGGAGDVDGGGWTGGEFVLGGGGVEGRGMSRRELMAKAAEERMRRQEESGGGG